MIYKPGKLTYCTPLVVLKVLGEKFEENFGDILEKGIEREVFLEILWKIYEKKYLQDLLKINIEQNFH